MPIPLFLVERLKAARMDGNQMADVFLRLAQVSDARNEDVCAINLQFVEDGDRLIPGDLIPMVTLSLERQKVVRETIDPEKVIDVPFGPAEAATDVTPDLDDEDPYPEE